jgi:hypothetical protein
VGKDKPEVSSAPEAADSIKALADALFAALKLQGVKSEEPKAEKTVYPQPDKNSPFRNWHMGLRKDCPLDYITVPTFPGQGAPTIPKCTQKVVMVDDNIGTLSEKSDGVYIKLFDDEVKIIKDYINSHGIAYLSKGAENPETHERGVTRVAIVKLHGDNAMRRDRREDMAGMIEPLTKYVYMKMAETTTLADIEEGTPYPTMMEEDAAKAVPASTV